MINLLPRFLRPTGGEILLDGVPMHELSLASLRRQLALVSQDVVLFDDSIAANIAYGGQRGAPMERIRAAAEAAYLLPFIESLPRGFDTPIGENAVKLSGGQRQRLSIARAILKDAPILLLDEATSALDSESERYIQASLERLMQGRTTFVVAHRLSTIERAHRIVVLEHGRIVESRRPRGAAGGGRPVRAPAPHPVRTARFGARVMTARPISRYPVPSLDELPDDIRGRILEVQEKSGFVPNVFLTLAHRPDEFRAFFAYHDALMLKPSGLTKGEREMIVVATSGANNCVYCVVAHGAILRIYEKNPLIAEQVATNYRKADIPPRQKAMLAFAMKVATASGTIEDADFEALRPHGFSDEDIWDIGAIAAFFALSNRMANMIAMRPNDEFYLLGRLPREKKA